MYDDKNITKIVLYMLLSDILIFLKYIFRELYLF
jgi:hypothetical protein